MADMVNHPAHYEGSTSLECIDTMKVLLGSTGIINYCIGNAWKYMWRYKNKNGEEDINKAQWYMDYCMKEIGGHVVTTDLISLAYRVQGLLSDLKTKEIVKSISPKDDKEV